MGCNRFFFFFLFFNKISFNQQPEKVIQLSRATWALKHKVYRGSGERRECGNGGVVPFQTCATPADLASWASSWAALL